MALSTFTHLSVKIVTVSCDLLQAEELREILFMLAFRAARLPEKASARSIGSDSSRSKDSPLTFELAEEWFDRFLSWYNRYIRAVSRLIYDTT